MNSFTGLYSGDGLSSCTISISWLMISAFCYGLVPTLTEATLDSYFSASKRLEYCWLSAFASGSTYRSSGIVEVSGIEDL